MRRRRLARFDERAAFDPSATFTLEGVGRYVAIHPMSDESGLLQSLGRTPSDCMEVDGYLENGGDVDFVQVQSSKYARHREVGIHARSQCDDGYRHAFIVVVPVAEIDRRTFEASLRRVAELRHASGTYETTLRRVD